MILAGSRQTVRGHYEVHNGYKSIIKHPPFLTGALTVQITSHLKSKICSTRYRQKPYLRCFGGVRTGSNPSSSAKIAKPYVDTQGFIFCTIFTRIYLKSLQLVSLYGGRGAYVFRVGRRFSQQVLYITTKFF